MRVVVTGGAGQLGTLVLRRLLADPAVQHVRSLDLRPLALPPGGKLEAVQADVRDPQLARHLEGHDALVHLAFVVVKHDPSLARSVNVDGSRNVLRCAAQAGVRRLVYTSSIAAYGVVPGHPQPLTEEAPRRYQPDFVYAATKWEVEEALDAFEQEHPEVAVVRLRPAILVGRAMEHAVGRAWRARLMLDAGGEAPLPVVWDEDVADAVLLALSREVRGAFNLAAEGAPGVREAARLAGMRHVRLPREVLVSAARLTPLLERLRLGEGVDPAWLRVLGAIPMEVSSQRAYEALGWQPRFPAAADVWRHFERSVPHHTDRRILLFLRLLSLAGPRAAVPGLGGPPERFHLALTGRTGGDFGVEVRDGRLAPLPAPPRPPTATLTLPAPLFLELLAGREDYAQAEAAGRLRVEGEAAVGALFAGMAAAWRALTAPERGWTARLLSRWMFARGGRATESP